MMQVFLIALFAFLASAGVVHADPVSGAIAMVVKWGAASAINSFILSTALSTGLSMVSQMMAKRNQPANNGGITVERPTVGDATPANIILGHYATAGNHVAPPYAQGSPGKTPNAYLTQIIDVCDCPIEGFINGVWIGEDWVELDPTPAPAGSVYPGRLEPVEGNKYRGRAWFKFYDGTQTAADPHLLNTGQDGPRPWSADMIGRGVAYAVCHFQFDQKLYSGAPEILFEVKGAKLYDPRKDSSVGGNGTHRFGNVSTYEYTENNVVMIYNIMRGIPLADGGYWGGRIAYEGLPLSNWFAAMNKCDVPRSDGKPTYRAGADVRIGPEEFQGDDPAGIIEELMAGCSATIAEVSGGIWHIRVGGPDLPVAFMSDGDIIISENESFDPFPSIDETINGLQTQYPEPRERWASKQAPTRYSPEYETQDQGRRRIGNLSLPTVTDLTQVQMLMRAYVEDGRRFRRHEFTLPPDYTHLTVLDSIGWTSEHNGYINNKSFEISSKAENLYSLNSRFSVRERDQGDYNWHSDYVLPSVINPPAPSPDPVQVGLPSVLFSPHEITDANGKNRRAAALMTWILEGQADITAVSWEIRPKNQTRIISNGSTTDVVSGRKVIESGIVGGVMYEGRAKVEAPHRRTDWGAWQEFTAPDIKLSWEDLTVEVGEDFEKLINDLEKTSQDVLENRQLIAEEVVRAQAEAEAIRAEVQLANEAIEAEELRALHEADLIRQDLQDTKTDLANTAVAIRGELATAQTEFNGDLTALHATVTSEYGQAISTGIATYDITVQGQFNSVVGQIEELTAKLTSADLIQNGKFQNADLSYWTTTGTVGIFTKALYPGNALVQSAPTAAVVRLNQNGTLEQTTDVFTLTAADRFRVRFSAAGEQYADSRRVLELSVSWQDGTGAAIGAPEIATFVVAQNRWGVISHEFDPPDNAVRATIKFRHAGDAPAPVQYLTAIEANTADQTVEADIITIKAAQATLEGALATYKTEVAARFGAAETAITSEQSARAAADNAMGQRVDAVQANIDGVSGRVTTNTTAIATANGAITALDTRLSSTFGDVQLLKDGEFLFNLAHWPEGNMTTLVARDKASANALNRDMPGAKAIRTNASGTSTRATERFPVALSERYAFGFYGARNHGSAPFPRVTLAFEANDGTPIAATGNFVNPALPTVNTYVYAAIDDIIPPIGATHARLVIEGIGTPNSTRFAYATGLSLRRMAAQDVSSAADIANLQTTFAGLDQSFASYKTEVSTRFGNNETLITNETTARTNADTAMGGRIDALVTRVGTAETAITSETTARTSADSALGGRVDAITTRVGTAETAISSEQTARANADNALGQRVDAITTRVGAAESNITTTQTSLSALDTAFGQYKTAVNTRFGNNETAISNEITARTNADSALGQRITDMGTRVGGAETRITATETAITNANAAIGSVSEEIQTKFGDTQLVRDPDFNDVLKYWTGGTLATNGDVVGRDKGNADFRLSQMPGRKALQIRNGMSGGRLSPVFDVSPAEVYDLNFYVARSVDSASVRVGIRWLNATGGVIGADVTVLAKPAIGAYEIFTLPELKPPSAARSGQVVILFGANGTSAGGNTFLTGITLRRRAAFEFASAAGITEAKTAASSVDTALTAYKTAMNTRVGNAESDISDERIARVANDNALNTRIETQISRINAAEATITTQGTTLVDANTAIANLESVIASKFGNTQLNRDPDFGDGLKHYGGALNPDLISRDAASTSWIYRDMPGRRAVGIKDNMTGDKTGPFFDASVSEKFEFGFYSGRQVDGPKVRVYIQWLNAANGAVGSTILHSDDTAGDWKFVSIGGIVPPAGTVKGRVVINRNANGGGNLNNATFITGIEVWRQTAQGVRSEAAIEEVRQTAASATQSLAALDLSTATRFGNYTGWGRLRVQSVANAGGSVSRIALTVAADGDLATPPVNAGIYLEARSDGDSQIAIDAARLLFTTGYGTQARKYPFFIDGGVVYMSAAMIKDGQITNAKIGNVISTPGYQPGQAGKGWIIDKNGDAEFNRVVIRRQLQVASGTVAVPFNANTMRWTDPNYPTIAKGVLYSTFALTNVAMAAWQGTDDTYIAVAGIRGATGTAIGTATGNELFGYTTKVAALTKWSGAQQLRIIFEFYAQGLSQISAHNIDWTLYKVS